MATIPTILVNDTVRLKVKFIDLDANGNQVEVAPVSVTLTISDSTNTVIVTTAASQLSSSEFYYDYTPSIAGTYKVSFSGILENNTTINVNQQIYVSTPTEDYRPTVFLREDEVIVFAADIEPLYLDPDQLTPYFPDAAPLEIGEFIHNYSQEIKNIFKFLDTEDGSNVPFIALEYIRAATCCELTRVYGNGGDDELSVRLGDLSITNRSLPRVSLSRANATTWCQIAAMLRKEMLTTKVGIRAVQPKGIPSMPTIGAGRNMDPYTGLSVYYTPRDLYGPTAIQTPDENPIPERGIRKHD
jgi:hypothetical protein